jgi:S-DNA-T family DNA segregation ATPase FtsK/SpoIIIE
MEFLSRQWLEQQADRIEAVFASHQVEAVVSGGSVSPRWIRFHVTLGIGTKIGKISSLSEEIAMAIGAPVVRVTRSSGVLAVEMPREFPEPVRMLALLEEVPSIPPVTAMLGLTPDGGPLLLNLIAPEVTHVLIAGATGSGKTELMRSMLLSLALYNRQAHLQLILVDPKGRGFAPLVDMPHLMTPVVNRPDEAAKVLDRVVDEMERRDRELAPATPRIVIAIDEVAELLRADEPGVEEALIRLSQRGREAGFHLLCSAQKPSADNVSSALKSNLPARLVGKVASGQDALVAAGVPGSNAELLVGRGDFVAVVGARMQRFQAAYTGLADIRYITQILNADESVSLDDYQPSADQDTLARLDR